MTRIDLNHAGPDELTSIPGIDSKRARQIVAQRAKNGPFRSWDDVEQVPGIGATLIEKVRAQATLGEGDGAEEMEAEGFEVEESEVDEESEGAPDEDELASLVALANLDLEAAMVYELVAGSLDEPKLVSMLQGFADDHRRHVRDLERCARDLGATVEERGEPVGGVLVALASTLGALDPDAAVELLITNEQLTNGTYETALWAVSIVDAEEILERNAEDEQHHLSALLDYRRVREARGGEDADYVS